MRLDIINDEAAQLWRVKVGDLVIANYETEESAQFWGGEVTNWFEQAAILVNGTSLEDLELDFERQLLAKAMRRHVTQDAMALYLGVKRSTLQYKLDKHGLLRTLAHKSNQDNV